ncbi:hypothetical protein ACFV4I_00435 [Nocardiopsis alba]|uniref:hypothetical protein n=1 Tax=Nocardiopsis alba TaxID=53437 RepID=UPI0036687748
MTIINTTQAGPDGEEPALLEYRLFTDPHPIRVSPQGAEEGENPEIDPARAQLMFVASNNGRDPVRLRKLSVEIPTGELAAQLALSLERAESTISLKGWTASRSGEVIEFTTTDPYTEIAPGQGLTFQISEIPVNHEVGAVELRITEGYEATGRGSLSIFTGKFPQDFYLDGFSADKYEIDNGGKVTLTWKRSEGVTTTLMYGGNDPEDVTQLERKEIKDVRTTTTFYLIGQVGDVQIVRSVLVTVLVPDLVVNSLTVNKTLNVGDFLKVDPDNASHGTGPGRFQAGNLIVRPGDVLLEDGIRVKGDLDVSGKTDIGEALTAKSTATVLEEFTAKKGATVYVDFRLTQGEDRDEDRVLWADYESVDIRNKLRLITDSVYETGGLLEAGGNVTIEGKVTAKKGATVYDDFLVTKGENGRKDRILWANDDSVDIRTKLRIMTESVYQGNGELEVGTSAKVGGKHVICYGHDVRIHSGDGGHLNWTSRHKKCTEDWSGLGLANAYWRNGSYDSGGKLKIEKI